MPKITRRSPIQDARINAVPARLHAEGRRPPAGGPLDDANRSLDP
jgi:hypothetical protein